MYVQKQFSIFFENQDLEFSNIGIIKKYKKTKNSYVYVYISCKLTIEKAENQLQAKL